MPYYRLYYHLVWATYERLPLITPPTEGRVHQLIAVQVKRQGARMVIINGMPDHVHLIVEIPPRIALAQFVKQVKGASSRYINAETPDYFGWQGGYSAFTLDSRDHEAVVGYVKRQKTHHRDGTLIDEFERLYDPDHPAHIDPRK